MMASVLQAWVEDLPFMQQSVLMSATRGPDGIRKDHVAKAILRWLRRSFLLSAFDEDLRLAAEMREAGVTIDLPYTEGRAC